MTKNLDAEDGLSGMYEAKTYKTAAWLDGAAVDVVIRAYVKSGNVQAIRSCRVTDTAGNDYPTISDGKTSSAGLDLTAMAAMLRRLEWAGNSVEQGTDCCPCCQADKWATGPTINSHAPDCDLATLLRDLP